MFLFLLIYVFVLILTQECFFIDFRERKVGREGGRKGKRQRGRGGEREIEIDFSMREKQQWVVSGMCPNPQPFDVWD